MSHATLLREIAERGLTLQADGPDLRLLGPRENMDAELVSRIRSNKPALLAALASGQQHQAEPAGIDASLLQRSYLLGRHGDVRSRTASYVYHEFTGHWDLPRLERALNHVVAAHEPLRMSFTESGRGVLAAEASVAIEVLDLRSLTAKDRSEALLKVREELSHRVLPLDRAPMLVVQACILDDDEQQLLSIGHDGLALDGISMFLFFRAWQRAYTDESSRERSGVPTLKYAQAVAKLRAGPAGQRSRQYWLDRLPALPAHPELPQRVDSSAGQQGRFTQREVRLGEVWWTQLKQRSADAGLTPTSVLLTAYAETLNFWGADRQFTISTTLANRPPIDPAMNVSIGQYSDVVLVAVDLDDGADFASRAAAVQTRLLRDLDHRHFSGLEVLHELQRSGQGAKARMPYTFNSALGFPESSATGDALSDFGHETFCVSQTPQVWLNVFVMEQAGELVIQVDALDDLYPEGFIDALVSGYDELLHRLCEAGQWSAVDPQLLPAAQRQVRAAVNDTSAPLPSTFGWEAFCRHAIAEPNAPAILTDGASISYGELLARAGSLARWLREQGVGRDELVALVMSRGPEQLIGVLAVAMAGAAYLPIDAHLPRQRQNYMLRDGMVRCVLTTGSEEYPADLAVRRVELGEPVDVSDLTAYLPVPQSGADADDLLYVLYTSGTTGEPKGVMVSHRSVVNVVTDCNERFSVGPADRFFGISAFNFDLSVYDIFGALSAGAAVIMPDHDGAADPAQWLRLCRTHEVTLWNSVPAIVAMLADHAIADDLGALASLRLIMMSGDRIPPELPRRLRKVLPHAVLMSLGGPTETTVWNILHPITSEDVESDSIPYGTPNRNNRCFILDDRGRQRPDGVTGEICASGFGLARGYWHDEQRTAQRFFDDAALGERIYRTGDLGRYLPDGTVQILGRKDFQIKVNGYRIEAGEVESRLAEIDGIRQAAVVRASGPLGSRLVAHIAGPLDTRPADADIQTRLRQALPEYMVPVSFSWHDELPLTGNGKVDRGVLTDTPVAIDAAAATEGPPPTGEVEDALVEIWSRVLGVPVPDVHTGFYDLGGSSLAAAQVLTLVRKRFGAAIPLDEFYLVSQVRSMAQRVAIATEAGLAYRGQTTAGSPS